MSMGRLGFGILLDATFARMLLVPALVSLSGSEIGICLVSSPVRSGSGVRRRIPVSRQQGLDIQLAPHGQLYFESSTRREAERLQ
jgi:hypothetical protein